MRHHFVLGLVVALWSTAHPGVVGAQEGLRLDQGEPTFGLTGGYGNVLGWLGVGAERYWSDGRASVVLGARYLPNLDDNPTSAAFGGAVRRYLGSSTHRALLEASVSLLLIDWATAGGLRVDSNQYYGPGLAAGYRYASRNGLHVEASLGAGWAVGNSTVVPLGSLAFGHAWHR